MLPLLLLLTLLAPQSLSLGLPEATELMMRSYRIDRDLSGMVLDQLSDGHPSVDENYLASAGHLLSKVSDEIATLRVVREAYKQTHDIQHFRMTAADALHSCARKFANQEVPKKVVVRVLHAIQMYGQPEISAPLWERYDYGRARRRAEEVLNLKKQAREILKRLEELQSR